MPNHIHGILILDKPFDSNTNNDDDNNDDNDVETRHALSLPTIQSPMSHAQKRFQNQGKNTVSSIIGSYKSAVTKHCNRLGLKYDGQPFGWQTRFYDHIIRNDAEYQRISDYIELNPENWEKDKFYSE